MNKVLKAVFAVLAVVSCSGDASSKERRKIVPLISTRADVERLLSKPSKLNRYQFDDERASILTGIDPKQLPAFQQRGRRVSDTLRRNVDTNQVRGYAVIP